MSGRRCLRHPRPFPAPVEGLLPSERVEPADHRRGRDLVHLTGQQRLAPVPATFETQSDDGPCSSPAERAASPSTPRPGPIPDAGGVGKWSRFPAKSRSSLPTPPSGRSLDEGSPTIPGQVLASLGLAGAGAVPGWYSFTSREERPTPLRSLAPPRAITTLRVPRSAAGFSVGGRRAE